MTTRGTTPNASARHDEQRAKRTTITVDTLLLTLQLDGDKGRWQTGCTIGRSGACTADIKREGDGCTPLGAWPIRAVLFRIGRAAPPAGLRLPWRWVHAADGWSDDVSDPGYNRPVRLPHGFSAETLVRDDMLYDIIVILGHNDDPPVPGKGSAIFFHLWDEAKPIDKRSTEGCVAISRAAMLDLLPRIIPGMTMEIR